MFHYKSYNNDKNKMDIEVEDKVQSKYRAQWYGTVLELDPKTGCATVKQEIDQHKHPIWKGKTVRYHCTHFRVIKQENISANL